MKKEKKTIKKKSFYFEDYTESEFIKKDNNNLVKVLPNIEGPRSEAHFVYPQSLKNVARVVAFRNFLYSKIRQWEF